MSMEMDAKTAALWPLAAELGAATSLTTGQLPLLRSTAARVAALCGASVELWRIEARDESYDEGWRLLAAERAVVPGDTLDLLSPPLDNIMRCAALRRQTIAITDPAPALCLPIIAHQRVQGVLLVRAARPASSLSSWREALEQFAPLLGLFLDTIEREPARSDQAAIELPANLPSQTYLGDHLERELARARRTRQSFAVLVVGLDQFDQLALSIGHEARDRVMQRLAVALRDTCRESDLLGRYGPDSFLLILPDSNGQGAEFAARRHLDHLYRRPIVLPGHEPLYLDISVGIALFPVDGLTSGELLASASDALATARRLGGRRAVAA